MTGGLSVLFLGIDSGTSRHRAHCLERLGHEVRMLDPHDLMPRSRLANYWSHHTGALGFGKFVRTQVLKTLGSENFDLVWVDSGSLIGPDLVQDLKLRTECVINYNVDDPYGPRDGKKWRLYLRSVPFYDLIAVVRDCNVEEAFQAGAKDVIRVHRSSDEGAHAPRKLSLDDQKKWQSEVAFVGTWMPERGPFLARLVERRIPLAIWGDRWPKANEWPVLRPYWRGPALEKDDEYTMAVQCAKVCVGLLSKGNRDLCTQRSFEIPWAGGVLCAERTSEHLALYEEGVEAVFWSDADECAEQCERLLNNETWRRTVARNGQLRARRNGTTNEMVISQIISRAFQRAPEKALAAG